MKSRSLKTVVSLCLAFIVVMAAAVSAHVNVRQVRSKFALLQRASSITRWVLTGGHALGPVRFMRAGEVVQVEPPVAPRPDGAPLVPSGVKASKAPRAARPAPPAAAPEVPPAQVADQERPLPPGMRDFQPDRVEFRGSRPIFKIDQDYVVRAGETVENVILVSGSLTVEGRVRGDVAVIVGKVHVAGTGVIDGDLVNVGGGVDVDAGGAVHGDLITVAGALSTAGNFSPGGEQVVVGSTAMGDRMRAFMPWLTSGLFLGRVVVPSLPWVWLFLAIAFAIALVLSLVFESPVRACAESISSKPLTTFLLGLLVLLLIGPLSFVLAVSIVGIAVLPFLLCALLIATVIGKVAVARWLGWSIVREGDPDNRGEAIRSFAIGFGILTFAYMIPLLGLVTWVTVNVLGLGSATATMFKALRRENPAPPKPPAPPVPEPLDQPAFVHPPMAPAAPMAYATASEPVPSVAEIAYPTLSAPPHVAQAVPSGTGAALLALPRATLMQRVAAGLLDCLLVLFIFQMVQPHQREAFWFLTLLTMYNAAFWTWRGTTIGGIICRLRVVRTDGRAMEFGDSVIRGLSSLFSLLALGIGFLWIRLGDNEDRQAWHDLIAGTVVVRVARSTPLR